ncbi:hypothetical protein EDC01DRAFT_686976 [Geopyxis carbonaria]|nr:hypothetical protein EDC01DRAFT_686976 [Geopyxis carbonaria]
MFPIVDVEPRKITPFAVSELLNSTSTSSLLSTIGTIDPVDTMAYLGKTAVVTQSSFDTCIPSLSKLSDSKDRHAHRSVRQWMGEKLWVREVVEDDSKQPLRGHRAIAKLLLAIPEGVDMKRSGRDGNSPLRLAVEAGDVKTVEILLNGPGVSERQKELGLIFAAFAGHLDVVKLLLDRGTNVDTSFETYGSVLEIAAYSEHKTLVDLLLERKANPNPKKSGPHGSPLQAAAFEGNLEIVTRLHAAGAKINAEGGIHGSALQAACYRGQEEVVKYLLSHGADVNLEGGEHGSPLEAATSSGQREIMKILQSHGAITPTTLQRPSTMDYSTDEALKRIGREVQRGRSGTLERRVEKILQEFRVAIAKKEDGSRTLEVLNEIALRAFKVAVTIGREGFLEFLIKNGMMLLVIAVSEGYEDGAKKMAQVWTRALSWAVDQNKSQLVRRMLSWCVADFKACIEAGEDDHAEAMIKAGIEIQLAMMSLEPRNEELRDLMIDVWIASFEEMIQGKFASRIEAIIRGFADQFQLSKDNVQWEAMRILGTTGMISLQRALLFRKNHVVNTLSKIFQEVLQRVFENERLAAQLIGAGLEWEGSSELTELVLDIGTTLMKIVSSPDTTNTQPQEAVLDRPMLFQIVGKTVRSVLTTASNANRLDHVEFLINYVARKQIREGRLMDREAGNPAVGCNAGVDTTYGDRTRSIAAVFAAAKSKGGLRSVVDDSLDRIIGDLGRDRSSLPPGVKERKKYTRRREIFWHKNWHVYLWCFGRV